MAKSVMIALALIASMFLLFDSTDAKHCRRRDYRCCRRKIDYGRCHGHVRRWAYNVSCGECVPFDYSGCGGDENVFEHKEECLDCCRETRPCPRYDLPKPHSGCAYKWLDGPDSCARPRLECSCPATYCRPDSCRTGQRCIPERSYRKCDRCPCPQYRCATDPCHAVSRHLRPCEKCVAVPSPRCHQQPCPLIAHREDHCAPAVPVVPVVLPPRRHHCPVVVECPPQGDPCQERPRCHAHPRARCVVDPCNCQQHWWTDEGKTFGDEECDYQHPMKYY